MSKDHIIKSAFVVASMDYGVPPVLVVEANLPTHRTASGRR